MNLIFKNTLAATLVSVSVGLSACSSEPGETAERGEAGTSSGAAATTDAGEPQESAAAACAASSADECGVCMQGACCDALRACEQDPDCMACVAATDSEACERSAATHARVDAYLSCRGGERCATTCVAATGGTCTELLDGLVAPDCQTCLEESCCDQVASCHGNAVCWDGCFTNHNETKCHGDPDGHSLFHAMGACVSKKCAAKCK